jgi:hypothetical protein
VIRLTVKHGHRHGHGHGEGLGAYIALNHITVLISLLLTLLLFCDHEMHLAEAEKCDTASNRSTVKSRQCVIRIYRGHDPTRH